MGSVERLVKTARESGADEEREIIRSIIDNTAFGIAALEVLEEGSSAEASRAVASYGRLLMQVLDARSAASKSSSSEPEKVGTTTKKGWRGANTSRKSGQ